MILILMSKGLDSTKTELQKYIYCDCFANNSDLESHTVEESPANTTEESLANAEEYISVYSNVSLAPRCS